jgi:hypothetical protein
MTMGQVRFQCSRCMDKFKTEQGAKAHIANHHRKRGGEVIALPPRQVEDDDESFADRAIAAHLDRAMGIPTDDDWLID